MDFLFSCMKIRTKIVLSLVITAICIFVSFGIFLTIKSNRDRLLMQSYHYELEASVRTAMRLNEKTMVNLAKDYTNWDEMVEFTFTKNESWSRSNLSTVTSIHSLSGLWIFNKSKRLIYALTDVTGIPDQSALFTDTVFHFLEMNGAGYFFSRQTDSLYEFAAATIHPTVGSFQSSPSFGYFFICRTMDRQAIRNLEEISGASVRLLYSPSSKPKPADDSQITTTIQLHALSGSPVGSLIFVREQPLLKSYLAITNLTSLFYFCFALILLVVVSFMLYHWLNFPLKKITESLALEDSDLIKPIATQKNEFGQIALMIERFFRQKKELADIIYEKNEVLASLADAESKNRAILSAIPDHLFRINLFGVISDYQIKNPGDFFMDPDQMAGRNFEEIMPASLSFQLHRAINDINKTKQPQSFNFSTPSPKDQVSYFEATISLTNLGDYLVVMRNITTRKEAELALYRLLEKEGALNRLKTHFLTTVSHEFRTPLSAILSNIQMLELYDEKWSADKKAPAFSRILQAVKQMNSLLNDLSVVARDEAGKFQINPVRFDIALFLDELVRDTTNMLSHSPSVNIENTVRDCMVTMDKELVRYIFTNLLSNAVKFTPSDEQITVSLNDSPDNGIILQIRDHGIGIAPQDLPTIFEPFHRGQNVAGYPGTGLGLSIVKRCVDLHKGNITIESILGKGTVVTAVLPQLLN